MLKLDSTTTSSATYELNENWMRKMQADNQHLLDMLEQVSSTVQFVDKRRDILDLIVVDKCITIQGQVEQSAILSSPKHRDFYLLFQRKLKCMIQSCETLSTGMVGVGGGDMRAFVARTIREQGCNVLYETKVGYFIESAVEWANNNLAFIPFIDTIGSVFKLIVTLRDERDRYIGVARVADFATMVCLPHYGTTSLDNAVEKLARLMVCARCGMPSCHFVETEDEFGKMKQLMIYLLADSDKTPAMEQASKAAECAFAHIMKPNRDSLLAGVMNYSILEIGLDEALAATILGRTIEDLKKLDPFSLSPTDTLPRSDTPIASTFVTDTTTNKSLLNGASVSISPSRHAGSYASSEQVLHHEAKLQELESKNQQLSQELTRLASINHQLFQKLTRLEKALLKNESGGGTMYANPEEVFKDKIAEMENLTQQLKSGNDEVTTIYYQVSDLTMKNLVLEERITYLESNL